MNYEQLTSLFRAEERSTAFVLASLANIGVTIARPCFWSSSGSRERWA